MPANSVNPHEPAPAGGDVAGETPPFWSVMIPTYCPQEVHLRQALESVLSQDPGGGRMQIEVVDDCSPGVDVAALVAAIGQGRVAYSGTPRNLGLAGCWNTCIERARGRWVHILHQDDYVLPGFYDRLARAAEEHPEVSLLATRSFFVDDSGIISGVTPRLAALEKGGHSVESFFEFTPVQCPGVSVRRNFYVKHGGFRADFKFLLDAEMWTRVIAVGGGVAVPEVLSCYRSSHSNESNRLARTADNLRDYLLLHQIHASQHQGFNHWKSLKYLAHLASHQIRQFRQRGDTEAVAANLAFWRREIPWRLRFRQAAKDAARLIFH